MYNPASAVSFCLGREGWAKVASFDYGKRFSSTPGYSFVRGSKKEPELQAQYELPQAGKKNIACKVQVDMGGEGLWV